MRAREKLASPHATAIAVVRRVLGAVTLGSLISASASVSAFPEFQTFSEKNSGRTVDCSMCHVNSSGPLGNEDGQLGSLKPEELERANKARAALNAGQDVDSPILNAFGNQIIKTIGMARVIELRSNPAGLAEALGTKSDLDGDGIPDSREYLDGTDPLNRFHGEPWRLLVNNLVRYKFDVILAILSVVLILYGLMNLLKGFGMVSKPTKDTHGLGQIDGDGTADPS